MRHQSAIGPDRGGIAAGISLIAAVLIATVATVPAEWVIAFLILAVLTMPAVLVIEPMVSAMRRDKALMAPNS